MPYHLTDTTSLKCDKGTMPAPLSVTSQTFTSIEGKLQATEEDKQPNVNIKSFGVCSITRMPCNPAPTKWQETSVFEIDGKKELLDSSTCPCAVGGKISVVKSAQNFSVENEKSIYEPIAYVREEDKSSDSDEDYNDYKLLKNGQIVLVKERGKMIDRLVSASTSNKFQLDIEGGKKTLIHQMSTISAGVSKSYTSDVGTAVNFYNFLNRNTQSNIEFGLARFIKNGSEDNYLIFTDFSIDESTLSYNMMLKYIGGYKNLIAFYHNHDGHNGNHPEEVGNQWGDEKGGDQRAYRRANNAIIDSGQKVLPRFMTIHEGLGNILIEINGDKHFRTGLVFTAETVQKINKIDYYEINK